MKKEGGDREEGDVERGVMEGEGGGVGSVLSKRKCGDGGESVCERILEMGNNK